MKPFQDRVAENPFPRKSAEEVDRDPVHRKVSEELASWRVTISEAKSTDPRTGRAYGDHGTTIQAIEFATDCALCPEPQAFLESWMEGSLDEWPEFYRWIEKRRGGQLSREQEIVLIAEELDLILGSGQTDTVASLVGAARIWERLNDGKA